MTKLIILDRDGVINYDSMDYIKSVEEFRPIPSSLSALTRLTQAGFTVAIATNQSGVARGYYRAEDLSDIHDFLLEKTKALGGAIAVIEHCPHLPESGCECRKPKPGMLFRIAKQFNKSLEEVPYVGDRESDIQAALACGAKPYLVRSEMTGEGVEAKYPDVPVFNSLYDCVNHLLRDEHAIKPGG